MNTKKFTSPEPMSWPSTSWRPPRISIRESSETHYGVKVHEGVLGKLDHELMGELTHGDTLLHSGGGSAHRQFRSSLSAVRSGRHAPSHVKRTYPAPEAKVGRRAVEQVLSD